MVFYMARVMLYGILIIKDFLTDIIISINQQPVIALEGTDALQRGSSGNVNIKDFIMR